MSKDTLFSKSKFPGTCIAILLLTLTISAQGAEQPTRLIPAPKTQTLLCPNLKFFINTKISPAQTLQQNTSQICNSLETSCCTTDNFQSLQNWWQAPSLPNGLSRVQTRAAKLEDIALFTSRMLENYQSLLSHALKISSSENSTAQCQQASAEFSAHRFPQSELDVYLSVAQKCWSYLSSVNTSLVCAACDPDAQNSLDFQNKQISLNAKAFYDFKESCLPMVNLNIYHVYPYLNLISSLVACNSSGKLQTENQNSSQKLAHKNLLTDSEMEDAELIFSRSISFGVESNINSEGDYLYTSKLYHSMIDSVSMIRDTDFTLAENSTQTPTTLSDDGINDRKLLFVAGISHRDNAKLTDYKNYFKAKAHGDMFRMERVHVIQRALNLQELRDSAIEDRKYRNQLRTARRLKSDPRKLGMQDESLHGNKLNFSNEKSDTLFIRRLAIRRLGSDDSEKSDDEDDDDTAKSDANKDTEDDDDEDDDDSDEDSDPDPKEITKKLSQTMSYSFYQGEFGEHPKIWGKKKISVEDFKKKIKNVMLCFDAQGTKDHKDENEIVLFKDEKKCAKFGDLKKKNDDEAKKDEEQKKKDKKEKEDKKKKKKSSDEEKEDEKKKKKEKKEKEEDEEEDEEKIIDNSIEKFIDDEDFKFPEDFPKKEMKKKQLKCYEKFDKFRIQKTDNDSKKKYENYKKKNKSDCETSWDNYVGNCKSVDAGDKRKDCKKLFKDMKAQLKKDQFFKKQVIKILTKLEEGIKNKFWKKDNISKSDDEDEDRRLWGAPTSPRRLTQEKDAEFLEYKQDKGRQLNLDNSSMVNSNFAPQSPNMFIKPEDLPSLKKYIHNPVGPSPKERKLFETYYKNKAEFSEIEKNMSHYQKKDFYRKLEMMNEFKQDTSDSSDDDQNSSADAEAKATQVLNASADGVVAGNNQTVKHVERNQGESVSQDGLTQTKYSTVDAKQSSNTNNSENIRGVNTLAAGTDKFSQKLTKLASGEMRRLDTTENQIVGANAGQVMQVKNDAGASDSNMKTLHVEKNSGESVSEDGLTTTNFKTEDISQTEHASKVENLTTVNTVQSKVGSVNSFGNSETEKKSQMRRLNRQLLAENLEVRVEEIINLDRLAKESGIMFGYSEISKVSLVGSDNFSGLDGFGIEAVKVKNLNALARLETVLKESKMGSLIEEKIMGLGSKVVGAVVAAMAFVLGML